MDHPRIRGPASSPSLLLPSVLAADAPGGSRGGSDARVPAIPAGDPGGVFWLQPGQGLTVAGTDFGSESMCTASLCLSLSLSLCLLNKDILKYDLF